MAEVDRRIDDADFDAACATGECRAPTNGIARKAAIGVALLTGI